LTDRQDEITIRPITGAGELDLFCPRWLGQLRAHDQHDVAIAHNQHDVAMRRSA
jgi:hypothetical protein